MDEILEETHTHALHLVGTPEWAIWKDVHSYLKPSEYKWELHLGICTFTQHISKTLWK